MFVKLPKTKRQQNSKRAKGPKEILATDGAGEGNMLHKIGSYLMLLMVAFIRMAEFFISPINWWSCLVYLLETKNQIQLANNFIQSFIYMSGIADFATVFIFQWESFITLYISALSISCICYSIELCHNIVWLLWYIGRREIEAIKLISRFIKDK